MNLLSVVCTKSLVSGSIPVVSLYTGEQERQSTYKS